MNLLILINSLQMGGAERMACFLAGEWAQEGHAVTLLTLDGPHEPYFPLDARVALRHLGVSGPSRNGWEVAMNFRRRIAGVRRSIKDRNCDVAIGFGGACLALTSLATIGMKAKSIAYEQTDPLFTEREMGSVKRSIHRMSMRLADAIVVQSNAARDVLPPVSRRSARIIPNPVKPASTHASPESPGHDGFYQVVALGRLNIVKGFDVLLQAWAQIQSELPRWRLVIHGEGEERPHLERIINALDLKDRAQLPGSTDQAEQRLAEANLFVMSSRTEGFPNSLCEAMAVGLPVVSTDCRCGPSDIVTPGRDGILVPVDDVNALGGAILEMARDPQRLAVMGAAASGLVQRFDKKEVLLLWATLLTGLANQAQSS